MQDSYSQRLQCHCGYWVFYYNLSYRNVLDYRFISLENLADRCSACKKDLLTLTQLGDFIYDDIHRVFHGDKWAVDEIAEVLKMPNSYGLQVTVTPC